MIIDAHAHVYRRPPGKHVPWPIENYLETLARNKVDGAVLVQPSFLGTNHEELVSALNLAPGKLRAVGVANDSFPRGEMLLLHNAGVRGVRLNFFRGAHENLASSAWRKVIGMLEQQGWHLELNVRDENMAGVLKQVQGLSIPITIDHFGRPDPELGVASPGFRALLELGKKQTVYIKLTAIFRSPFKASKDCFAAWMETVGAGRALWGSDCPWVEMNAPPSYEKTLSWLDECALSPQDKAAVLGRNARSLYGFPAIVPNLG